jgi:thioredoxin reductase (NADPH)
MPGVREVVVIGAGPAGIAAATYLGRAGLNPLIFECSKPGGLLRNANLVENYPGFSKGITGEELAARFAEHLERLRIEVRKERVSWLGSSRGAFVIKTDAGRYASRAVIVAAGTLPKAPEIRGAQDLRGKYVFSDLVSVPRAGSRGRTAIVIGGGDAAFDYAISLDERGYDVIILTRSSPRCLPLLLERVVRSGMELRVGVTVESVERSTDGIKVRCKNRGRPLTLSADLLLAAFGRSPNLEFIEPKLRARIGIPRNPPETAVPGLFVAGDVVRGPFRQTGIAVGDGILAAMLAECRTKRRTA